MYPLTAATVAILLVAACTFPAVDAAPRAHFTGPASVAQFSHLAGSDSPLLVKRGNRATYYDVGLGACGSTNSNAELVAALNAPQFGNVPGSSPWCGKCISVTNGKTTAVARIVDKCPGCPDRGLDMSPSLFQHFAELGAGVIDVTWQEVPCGGGAPAPAPAPAVPKEEPKPVPAPAREEPKPAAPTPSPSPAAPAREHDSEWQLGTPVVFQAPEPKATPPPAEPKKEEPKPQPPKKEEPKPQPPKKEEPKPQSPKKEEKKPDAVRPPTNKGDLSIEQANEPAVDEATRRHVSEHAERVKYIQELFNMIVAEMYQKSQQQP